MIVLITGASHTGKTALAQRLLEQYHYPYLLSLIHISVKMYEKVGFTIVDETNEEYIMMINL